MNKHEIIEDAYKTDTPELDNSEYETGKQLDIVEYEIYLLRKEVK